MEHWINLEWPVDSWQLEKIFDFYEVRNDTIVWNFKINGLDLTNYEIRGELYDLNVSNLMANDLAGPVSAPQIVVTDTGSVSGIAKFTATIAAGLTSAMQPYSQVEFQLTSPTGAVYTIMQQPIHFQFQRIVWTNEASEVAEEEVDGQDPLF
jgi:hypothetical protein